MKTVIIGNGIIGLTTALRLADNAQKDDEIVIIGKRSRPNSATMAAGAMLNSFCEIEKDTFKTEIDTTRFEMSYDAAKMWPGFVKKHLEVAMDNGCLLKECRTCMGSEGACYELGTYLINNCSTDSLEDENFDAVVKALDDFYEPYSIIDPKDIPNYKPQERHRATKAIYIHNEGWLNPKLTLDSILASLEGFSCVTVIDDEVDVIIESNKKITKVKLKNGGEIEGDSYLLSIGAAASKLIEKSDLSIKIPRIFNGVGVSVQVRSKDYPLEKVIRTPNRGLACGLYTVPFYTSPDVPYDEILIGSSNYIAPFDLDGPKVGAVQNLLTGAMEQVNTNFYKAEITAINYGNRPESADTYPVFGKTSISNFVVCTGTKRDGFHLSPLLSELLVKAIHGEEIDSKYDCFKPERQLIRNYTRQEAIDISVKHKVNASYQHGFVPSHDRLVELIERSHREDLEKLHDQVGAVDWGIPPSLIDMYRYGHIK